MVRRPLRPEVAQPRHAPYADSIAPLTDAAASLTRNAITSAIAERLTDGRLDQDALGRLLHALDGLAGVHSGRPRFAADALTRLTCVSSPAIR
jgi:hypothetical protein